jgi:hypothetical protein
MCIETYICSDTVRFLSEVCLKMGTCLLPLRCETYWAKILFSFSIRSLFLEWKKSSFTKYVLTLLLRGHYATSRKVADSRPDEVNNFFQFT